MTDTDSQPVALTIAGSDSAGSAGIQADLKTFTALGVHGATAITAITAQNNDEVRAIEATSPGLIRQQIEAVFAQWPVAAIKIGVLTSTEAVGAVRHALTHRHRPIVLDPVFNASSGACFLPEHARLELIQQLSPMLALLTPNLDEAAALLACSKAADQRSMVQQAQALLDMGPAAVLLKGGHGVGPEAVDVLAQRDGSIHCFSAPRHGGPNCRGTGCTLSAAITAGLAHGRSLPEAVDQAKRRVTAAIVATSQYPR